MKARNISAFVILGFAFCHLSSAQNAPTVSFAGAQEQVIQIEVTPADRAAVAVHRRVHTNGALRPGGGHYPSKTFETDSSGALVEVTGNSSLPLSTGQATTASDSSGAQPFAGPGFYPADVSLVSTTGQTIPQAQAHNIYINCTAACWGNPSVFETNLFSSDFIHVVDQYVGSEANGRYSLGVSLQITYPVKSQSSFPNLLNDGDIDAILHAAALKLGSGYNHIFNVFVPKGVDYCGGYSPPYTSCFSPDNNSTWTFCALHSYSAFADIPNAVYGTLEPYPDVFSMSPLNGVPTPFYACDVGQPFPYSSDTTPTPNGVLVDSVTNFVSHELFETITDPDGSEWQAQDGYFLYASGVEMGDVCEFNSPRHFLVFTPFYISGHLYEIQPEYSNKYHACVTVP